MREVKPAEFIFICFLLLHASGFAAALNCTSPTPEGLFAALEKNVFPRKLQRPVNHFSTPLNITVGLIVVGILGVDEKSQLLSSFVWQTLEWDIEWLSWDAKECGTSRITVPQNEIWMPDILITEIVDEDKSPKSNYVYLHNTGHVYDDRPIRVVSSCNLGIYTFPFEIQNCTLTIGSYMHFGTDIRVTAAQTNEEALQKSRNLLQTNGEWELTGIELIPHILKLQKGSFSQLKCNIILRRRPTMYVVNLLIPSCFLITVDLFSFLLPPQSVDRSAFKMTLILGYTVFLLIVNDMLPTTGDRTPLISVFFSISLALMIASLLETVLITNIQFSSSHHSRVPRWLSTLVLEYLARLVCIPPQKKTNRVTVNIRAPERELPVGISHITMVNNWDTCTEKPPVDPTLDELRKMSADLKAILIHIDNHLQGSHSAQEWHMIGLVIDRLLFAIYIIFISLSFICVISIWSWNESFAQ